jgi:hypothetical protein
LVESFTDQDSDLCRGLCAAENDLGVAPGRGTDEVLDFVGSLVAHDQPTFEAPPKEARKTQGARGRSDRDLSTGAGGYPRSHPSGK